MWPILLPICVVVLWGLWNIRVTRAAKRQVYEWAAVNDYRVVEIHYSVLGHPFWFTTGQGLIYHVVLEVRPQVPRQGWISALISPI